MTGVVVPVAAFALLAVSGGLSDVAVTQLGLIAVAVVGVFGTLITQRAARQAAREGLLERRQDEATQRDARTLAQAVADCDTWRERYYDQRDHRVRLEAYVEYLIAHHGLPPNAGVSGGFPPYVPPALRAPRPDERAGLPFNRRTTDPGHPAGPADAAEDA